MDTSSFVCWENVCLHSYLLEFQEGSRGETCPRGIDHEDEPLPVALSTQMAMAQNPGWPAVNIPLQPLK